VVDDDFEAE
jgi:hypothetical protein